jgi:Peroxidase
LGLHDNAGVEPSIDALSPIVDRHAVEGVSRADIWALSAVVGTDVTQRSNSRIDFRINWWGRVDCENTGQACLGEDGSPVECSAKKGPHHTFPSIHMNTHELYQFFSDEFGFNQRDTVAIMGAHTLGVVREEVRRCFLFLYSTLQPEITHTRIWGHSFF